MRRDLFEKKSLLKNFYIDNPNKSFLKRAWGKAFFKKVFPIIVP